MEFFWRDFNPFIAVPFFRNKKASPASSRIAPTIAQAKTGVVPDSKFADVLSDECELPVEVGLGLPAPCPDELLSE